MRAGVTGDYAGAAEALERPLDIYRDLGDRLGQAKALGELGEVRRLTGEYPAAAEAMEQALDIHRDLGSWSGEAGTLNASRIGIARLPMICRATRFGWLCPGPVRLRGRSSAWRAGLAGSPHAPRVAVMDLGEPPVDRHELAVRAGGHVAARQRATKGIRRGFELAAQDVGESAFLSFDDGA
jgi:tetratricopeptide (TPR) repeat protein